MGRISAWNPLFESSINSDVFRLRSLQKWGKVILIDADPLFCIQTRLPLRSVFGCGSLRTQLPAPSRFMLFALKLDSLRIRLWPCPMAFPGKRQHTLRPGGGQWHDLFFSFKGKEHIFQGHPPQKITQKHPQEQWIIFLVLTLFEISRLVVSTRTFFFLLGVSISFFSFRAEKVVFEPFGSTGSTGRSPFGVPWRFSVDLLIY